MTAKIVYVKSDLAHRLRKYVTDHPHLVWEETRNMADEVIKDFQKTVRTWNHKPRFYFSRVPQGFTIATDDQVFRWVDKGTKAHKIPQPARLITFVGGTFTPKTQPGLSRPSSRKGGLTGQRFVSTYQVDHPGTEARGFTIMIVEKWKPRYQERVRIAIGKARRAAGV